MKLDSKGRPVDHSHKLTAEQANSQRAEASKASEPNSTLMFERKATLSNSDDDDQHMSYDQERALKKAKKMAREPLEKSSQAKESTHGMITRSQAKTASGAGGLRPAVGSGQTDTCVANGHPSKT
jgi:hypothetical protein